MSQGLARIFKYWTPSLGEDSGGRQGGEREDCSCTFLYRLFFHPYHTFVKFRLHTKNLQWCPPVLLFLWFKLKVKLFSDLNLEWHYWPSWAPSYWLTQISRFSTWNHEPILYNINHHGDISHRSFFFSQRILTNTLVAHTYPHLWTLLHPTSRIHHPILTRTS